MRMNPYVELNNINFTYKKTGFSIKDISLKLYRGQTAVIAGGNGSGKTTLCKIIMGILKPDSGSVFMGGQDTRKCELHETAHKIGYVFQNPERQLFCASALEEIKFSLIHKGESETGAAGHAHELLSKFSLQDRASDFPLKFSRGEKQRLALLAVFAIQPPFFLLDEPASGLDDENRQKLTDMIQEIKHDGAGLCIITHDKQLIKNTADRIITLENGKVVNDEDA